MDSVRIGENFINPDKIDHVVEKPLPKNEGASFESKPHSIIHLNNGGAVEVPCTPEEVYEIISKHEHTRSNTPPPNTDSSIDSELVDSAVRYMEEITKQIATLNGHIHHMAEMTARLSMHITDGQVINIGRPY
jgi:hypothetical protein